MYVPTNFAISPASVYYNTHNICFISIAIDLASAQENNCIEFGAVRLNSIEPNVGRVNFCNGSQWGAICVNGWDHFDAAVVCRELGYTADGKSPILYQYSHSRLITITFRCSTNILQF